MHARCKFDLIFPSLEQQRPKTAQCTLQNSSTSALDRCIASNRQPVVFTRQLTTHKTEGNTNVCPSFASSCIGILSVLLLPVGNTRVCFEPLVTNISRLLYGQIEAITQCVNPQTLWA